MFRDGSRGDGSGWPRIRCVLPLVPQPLVPLPVVPRPLVALAVVALALLPLAEAGSQDGRSPGTRPPGAAQSSPIDDAILAREYQAYRDSLAAMNRYRVRYILVATEDEARRMIASIRSGGDFAALARRDSLHVESAAKGGDLGAHAGCRWARATVTMLEALAPGQIHPQPVKGSNGWGVYRLEAKEPVVPRTFARYREELLSGRFEPECPWKPPVDIAPAAPGSAPRSPAAAPDHPAAAPGPGPGPAPTPRRLP